MRIGLSTLELGGDAGTEPYVHALTRALLARDEPPELVLYVLEGNLPWYETFSRQAEVIPVPETFRPADQTLIWYDKHLPELVRHQELEVMHLPGTHRLNWRGPCPAIATINDLTPFRDTVKNNWKHKLLDRLTGQPLKLPFDAVIVPSEHLAREVRSQFELPAGRIAVIRPGLDPEQFHPGSAFEAKTKLDARFDLPQPFFLYVARLEHPAANHVTLLAAFNRFKRRARSPWLLMLVGEDGDGAEAIHAAIRQSPYAADIRVIGAVDVADLPRFYQAADALVFPSLRENPGLTPVEAMACGCPVISSTRGVLEEWVGEASSLIDPEDVDDIADKMAAMAGSLELRQRWRAAGLAQAKKFDWQRTAMETAAVYELFAPR